MNASGSLQTELIRWSTCNAAVLGFAAAAVVADQPLAVLSAAAALSFGTLLYRLRRRWTPRGRFGAANAITFARIGGVLALPWLPPGPIGAVLALSAFALDAVDGWVARRAGLAGAFGEFADKEGDALLVLMLCVMLYRLPGGFGPWVLVPGMLRYGFVLFVALARPPRKQEVRSAKGAWIAGFMTFSLIVALSAYPGHLAYAGWVVAAATALLCYSFAESTYRMYCVEPIEAK